MTTNKTLFGDYYQAHVARQDCNYVVALLKSFDHVVFDRTIDAENSIFEFFVPPAMTEEFLALMNHLADVGIVSDLSQKPNRLADPAEQL